MTTCARCSTVHLHIGDELVAEGSAGSHEHVWPVDGSVQGAVPLAGADQVDAAVRAAEDGLRRVAQPGSRQHGPACCAGSPGSCGADREELAGLCVWTTG